MLMLVSMQTMATETFTNDRTDFRDESIYFMITTRFTMEILKQCALLGQPGSAD